MFIQPQFYQQSMYQYQDTLPFSSMHDDLYQLDVEISQQQEIKKQLLFNPIQQILLENKLNESQKRKGSIIFSKQHQQYYINLIKLQINNKYQCHQSVYQKQGKQKVKKSTKTKTIHKTKKNSIRPSHELNFKLKSSKKHLSQLWANRLFLFLKLQMQKYQITIDQIKQIKQLIVQNLRIHQLVHILKQHHESIRKVIENEQIEFLNFIYMNTNITEQSKLMLFQTYNIFVEAINDPDTLKTWNHQLGKSIKTSQEITQKLKNKNLREIIQFAKVYLQKSHNQYKLNKSSNSNISYHWVKYFKDISHEKNFINKYQFRQQYSKLVRYLDIHNPSIENIRNAIQIGWFGEYLYENKINTLQIVKQILMNPKINIFSKMNMMISLPSIIGAVNDPSKLIKWSL